MVLEDVDRSRGFVVRVLTARYGVDIGRLRERGRGGSEWWRAIVKIRDGVGGIWFGECVVKMVGDGLETFFWNDPRLGEQPYV
jgi:hypothetical protein